MRILTGKAKGRKIKLPKGRNLRPTLGVVRKSIFDIIGQKIEGAYVLDLFAGGGSLGLESLSRNAYRVCFIERSYKILAKIKENVEIFDFADRAEFLKMDVFKAIKRCASQNRKFDIIFADPPYLSNLASETLAFLSEYGILEEDGWLIIEHHKKENLVSEWNNFVLFKEKKFGDILVTIFIKEGI